MCSKRPPAKGPGGFAKPWTVYPFQGFPAGQSGPTRYHVAGHIRFKLDGYRLEAVRHGHDLTLYSRRQNVLNQKFHYIASALDAPKRPLLSLRWPL
jgi:hypothetical protein